MPNTASFLDDINRKIWKSSAIVKGFKNLKGWTDPGEQFALEYVAKEMRNQPILDIGVGAGRTTDLLLRISSDYVGVDYTQEMIDVCHQKHLNASFFHADARDLSRFKDEQFSLVYFSFNGIDAVDFAGRMKIIEEVQRVLRPGGVFIVSAHNRHGPGCGELPRVRVLFSKNPLKLGWRFAKAIAGYPLSLFNFYRFRSLNEVHDEWAIMNCGAHHFSIVIMYTSVTEQIRQLASVGLTTEVIFDSTHGNAVDPAAPSKDAWWFHYVARKSTSLPSSPQLH